MKYHKLTTEKSEIFTMYYFPLVLIMNKAEERLQRISDLKKAWHGLDIPAEEKNRLTKQIIDRITYVRLKQDAEIKVDFL